MGCKVLMIHILHQSVVAGIVTVAVGVVAIVRCASCRNDGGTVDRNVNVSVI